MSFFLDTFSDDLRPMIRIRQNHSKNSIGEVVPGGDDVINFFGVITSGSIARNAVLEQDIGYQTSSILLYTNTPVDVIKWDTIVEWAMRYRIEHTDTMYDGQSVDHHKHTLIRIET